MKNFKKLVCFIAVTVMVMSLVACGSASGSKGIVGTWVDNVNGVDNIFTFKSDHTVKMEVADFFTLEGTYETDGDDLDITIVGETITYQYKIKGDTLELTVPGDETETFKRKK